MARMTVVANSILPCQEAFLVDAPTPGTSPHRWIQAKGARRIGGCSGVPAVFQSMSSAAIKMVVARHRAARRQSFRRSVLRRSCP